MSLASAGGFLTTEPPGKSRAPIFNWIIICFKLKWNQIEKTYKFMLVFFGKTFTIVIDHLLNEFHLEKLSVKRHKIHENIMAAIFTNFNREKLEMRLSFT